MHESDAQPDRALDSRLDSFGHHAAPRCAEWIGLYDPFKAQTQAQKRPLARQQHDSAVDHMLPQTAVHSISHRR